MKRSITRALGGKPYPQEGWLISGKTNHKFATLLAILLVLPLALAGCLGGDNGGDELDADDPAAGEPSLADEDAITIGTILPMTGALQAYGPSMEKATDLAAIQINEAGGILGQELQLVHEDSASDPTQAPQAFLKLVNQANVVGVVGAASSGVTSTLLSAAADANVLLVSPASTSPALIPADADGFFFRTVPSDALQGEVLAGLIEDRGDAGRVNAIAVNNDYGVGFVEVMDELLDLNEVVTYDPNAETFDSEVQSVCSGDPTAIAFIGYPQEGSLIMQQAYSIGCTDIPWYFSEGLKDPAFIRGAGETEDGTTILAGFEGTYPWSDPEATQGDSFMQAYMDQYEQEPGLFADTSYDATILIALAVQKAGTVEDREALIEALESLKDGEGEVYTDVAAALEALDAGEEIEWVGPSGDYVFDEFHSPGDALYGVWRVTEEGEIETVETGIEPGELGAE